VPSELELYLILDNYGTHKTSAIKRWLLRHRRFHLHFTPTGGSWLNLVERWFALLTESNCAEASIAAFANCKDAIRAYLDHHNAIPNPSSGPKPPTKSSIPSPVFVNVFLTQDTSSFLWMSQFHKNSY
jgi:hypothetical protein